MNTETITEPLQKNLDENPKVNLRTWWIIFTPEDGKIKSIKSNRKLVEGSNFLQVESNNPVCKQLVNGKESFKKYAMIWDVVNDVWVIDKKSETLLIKTRSNHLAQYRRGVDPSTMELHAKVFYKDNKLLLTANFKNIRISKNLSDIYEISIQEDGLLDIFVTRKNDPDYLVGQLVVDSEVLMTTGRYLIDIGPDISSKLDWNNISLYTKPVFQHYGFEIDTTYSIEETSQERGLNLYCSNMYDDANINITVVNEDKQLVITSSITDDQLYYFEGKKFIKLLVCDSHPDRLVGGIELSPEQVLKNKITIPTTFTWPKNPVILHRNKHIRLSVVNGEHE